MPAKLKGAFYFFRSLSHSVTRFLFGLSDHLQPRSGYSILYVVSYWLNLKAFKGFLRPSCHIFLFDEHVTPFRWCRINCLVFVDMWACGLYDFFCHSILKIA
nr:hypothetical protein CFP56_01516 [Quercus suber]